jgi:hypothetical protein
LTIKKTLERKEETNGVREGRGEWKGEREGEGV